MLENACFLVIERREGGKLCMKNDLTVLQISNVNDSSSSSSSNCQHLQLLNKFSL